MMIAIKNEHGQPFSLLLVAVGPSPELSDAQGAEIDSPKVQEIAEWVVEEVRGTDLVARYGPNAFAVALMHTGPEGAEMACERIRQALRRNLRNREYPNAIRLAAVSALDGEPLEDLLARADATLAEASPDAVGGAVPDDRDELDSTRDAVPTI